MSTFRRMCFSDTFNYTEWNYEVTKGMMYNPFMVFSTVVAFRNDFEQESFKEFSLNLHPSQDLMNQAYKVLFIHFQVW